MTDLKPENTLFDTRILKSEAVKVLEAEIKRLSKKNKI